MKHLAWRGLAILIGGLFVYAGGLKALDPAAFTHDVFNYRVLSWPIAVGVSFYLPWLEIVCGLALVSGRGAAPARWILTGLMLVFVGVTLSAKLRGLDISCGCFGHHATSLSWALGRDAAILFALGALHFHSARSAFK